MKNWHEPKGQRDARSREGEIAHAASVTLDPVSTFDGPMADGILLHTEFFLQTFSGPRVASGPSFLPRCGGQLVSSL